jgi:hypothetical protein
MPLVIDDDPQIRHQDCHGLHIRWIGFRSTYLKFKVQTWWEPRVHDAHQLTSWSLIIVPWHLFWRRRMHIGSHVETR